MIVRSLLSPNLERLSSERPQCVIPRGSQFEDLWDYNNSARHAFVHGRAANDAPQHPIDLN
jgi:hypothetical protein